MVRPRSNCPEKEALIELGKDLVKWAGEDVDELRCRYCQWYCVKHGFVRAQWDKMLQKGEFRAYYEMAQALLSQKYVDGTVNQSIAHRFLRVYCPDVKEEEDATKEQDLRLKKEIDKEESTNVDGRLLELLEALKSNDKNGKD